MLLWMRPREILVSMNTHPAVDKRGRLDPNRAFSYRDDPLVPAFPDERPIIIFDGHCVLCSRMARFVLRHDRRAVFRLMAAQTPLGEAIFRHFHLDPVRFETTVLLEQGRAWFKSEGVMRMCAHFGFPWILFRALQVLPRNVLDRLYDLVARNRLHWFGSQSACFLPDPAHRDRFLE